MPNDALTLSRSMTTVCSATQELVQRSKPNEHPQPGYISATVQLQPTLRMMLKVSLLFVMQDIVSFPNWPFLKGLIKQPSTPAVYTVPDLPRVH